jgi:hypothetical protein
VKSLRRWPAANARSWSVSMYSAVLCDNVVRDVEFELEVEVGLGFELELVVMERC